MEQNASSPLKGVQENSDGQVPVRPRLVNQLLATLSACLSSFTMGLTLGYSSPAIPEFRRNGVLTSEQGTWFGSLVALGAIFGGPVGGFLLNKTGRKGAIMYGAVPYVCGWLAIICGQGFIPLYIGRILTGIGMGITSVSVVVYVAEIASKEYRGSLGSLPQLTMVTGILTMYVMGIGLDAYWLGVASVLPLTFMVILMCVMPETPRWLLQEKFEERAMASLNWLRGMSCDTSEEYNEIKLIIDSHSNNQTLNMHEFTKAKIYKPLIISIGLMLLQQLTGIRVVIFYANDIFASVGFTGSLPSIIIGTVLVITTCIAMIFMDILGRKVLLLTASVLMTISCAVFGTYYYLTEKNSLHGIQYVSLISLSVYIMGNAIGLGTVPWLIMSEIFPVHVRGFTTSTAALINWSCAFTVTKTYSYLVGSIGDYWTFWLFGLIAFSGIFFVAFVVVETKGKSLEEIELEFEGRSYSTTIMYNRL